MAIRYREGRHQPWIVYWKNPFTGKTEELPCSTESDANKQNSLIKHRLKYERDSFRPTEEKQEPEGNTLEACYYLYLKEKRFSIKSFKTSMDNMKPCLSILGNMPIERIKRQDIEKVKTFLDNGKIKQVTVRARLAVLKTVLRWCAEKGLLENCPQFPKLPPAHYEHFIPPTPQEIKLLCEASPPHILRVILIGSQMGVRVGPSELLDMKWSDIDLIRGIARVRAAKKRKDQPWREVPIRKSLLSIMQEWYKQDTESGIVYLIHFDGKPVKSIKRAWATAMRNAGIARNIRPYDLRHAFGTEAIAAGIDVGTTAQLMGNDPKTLLTHYQHVANHQKRAAVEALPPIPNYGKKLRQNKMGHEN